MLLNRRMHLVPYYYQFTDNETKVNEVAKLATVNPTLYSLSSVQKKNYSGNYYLSNIEKYVLYVLKISIK